MVKVVALVVVVLIGALLVYASTQPDRFRIQRSASINAPPEKIFALINDFHSWGPWSPYEKLDPAMKRTFSGAANGTGAVYEWESNGKAGAGRMEIVESTPPSKIMINLDFTKPLDAHNVVEFTLEATGSSTNVTWTMRGHLPYLAKAMHVIFSMDNMVGKQFETGLANLKAIAEK
jgi:uncharacterized protein YndB with AHSA1/START domain